MIYAQSYTKASKNSKLINIQTKDPLFQEKLEKINQQKLNFQKQQAIKKRLQNLDNFIKKRNHAFNPELNELQMSLQPQQQANTFQQKLYNSTANNFHQKQKSMDPQIFQNTIRINNFADIDNNQQSDQEDNYDSIREDNHINNQQIQTTSPRTIKIKQKNNIISNNKTYENSPETNSLQKNNYFVKFKSNNLHDQNVMNTKYGHTRNQSEFKMQNNNSTTNMPILQKRDNSMPDIVSQQQQKKIYINMSNLTTNKIFQQQQEEQKQRLFMNRKRNNILQQYQKQFRQQQQLHYQQSTKVIQNPLAKNYRSLETTPVTSYKKIIAKQQLSQQQYQQQQSSSQMNSNTNKNNYNSTKTPNHIHSNSNTIYQPFSEVIQKQQQLQQEIQLEKYKKFKNQTNKIYNKSWSRLEKKMNTPQHSNNTPMGNNFLQENQLYSWNSLQNFQQQQQQQLNQSQQQQQQHKLDYFKPADQVQQLYLE